MVCHEAGAASALVSDGCTDSAGLVLPMDKYDYEHEPGSLHASTSTCWQAAFVAENGGCCHNLSLAVAEGSLCRWLVMSGRAVGTECVGLVCIYQRKLCVTERLPGLRTTDSWFVCRFCCMVSRGPATLQQHLSHALASTCRGCLQCPCLCPYGGCQQIPPGTSIKCDHQQVECMNRLELQPARLFGVCQAASLSAVHMF